MNFAPPSWVRKAGEEALQSVATNHYSHPKGRLRLREAIKRHYEADFNRSLDVETEILVTSGANEGQFRSCDESAESNRPVYIQANTLFLPPSWSMGTRPSSSNPSSISTFPPLYSTEVFRSTSPCIRTRLVSISQPDTTGKSTSMNYG